MSEFKCVVVYIWVQYNEINAPSTSVLNEFQNECFHEVALWVTLALGFEKEECTREKKQYLWFCRISFYNFFEPRLNPILNSKMYPHPLFIIAPLHLRTVTRTGG